MNRLLVLLCLIVISCNSKKSNTNSIACKKVEEQLAIIHDAALMEIGDSIPKGTPDAVTFFWTLAGIASKSPCGDLGCLEPTAIDYIKWQDWYQANKAKLIWDEKKNDVSVNP